MRAAARVEAGEGDEGEAAPPQPGGQEREPNGESRRKAEALGRCEQREAEGEDETAAEVPEGEASARDGIAPVVGHDFAQEGVVEDDRCAEAEVGDDEEQAAQQVETAFDEEEETRSGDAHVAEEGHQALLQLRVIGDRPQDRQQDHLQQDREGDAEREEGFCGDGHERAEAEHASVGAHCRLGEPRQIGPEEPCHDDRGEGRVRPVVDHPAEDFPPVHGCRAGHRFFPTSKASAICPPNWPVLYGSST
jgi:hypothetical protein